MSAVNYNFIIEQGSEFNLQFQYNDAANNSIDLSQDKAVVMQILPENQPISSGLVFSSKAPASMEVNNWALEGNNKGLISFKLGSNYTSGIAYNTAKYDLDVVSTADLNKSVRLAYGTITIQQRQTLYPEVSLSTDPAANNNNNTNNNNNNNNAGSGGDTTPSTPVSDDLCYATSCTNLDIYSVIYNGSGISLTDDSTVSGYVVTSDTRKIENVELVINNLNHNSPQDLQFFLAPPSGNKILLSANQKIPNYSSNFSYMFSNKSAPSAFLHNISKGDMCNIYNKTDIVKYSSESLNSSFNHLFNQSGITGNWNLIIRDTDPIGSGYIDGWKLIVTYIPTN